MLKRILPDKIDNTYTGSKIALYVFVLITFFTIIRSLIHIIAPDGGSQTIAGFPIDTYSIEASKVVILMFSLWGLSQLLVGLVYLFVLLKYRSIISLMYLLVFVEYLLRLLLGIYKPAISEHVVPGGIANYVLIPLSLIMFYISIRNTKNKIKN